jgi:hypothetical protein
LQNNQILLLLTIVPLNYFMMYSYSVKQWGGGGGRRPETDKHLPPTLYWKIVKKSRHLGFGVFIDILFMAAPLMFIFFFSMSNRVVSFVSKEKLLSYKGKEGEVW